MNKNIDKRISSLFLAGLVASGITVSACAENTKKDVPEKTKIACENDIDYHYNVRQGDNLYNLCIVFYGDGNLYTEVAEYNNIEDPSCIKAGSVINFPKDVERLKNKEVPFEPKEKIEYEVQSGDTLTGICKTFYDDGSKPTAWKLATFNNMLNPNYLVTGQKIIIIDYESLLQLKENDYSKYEGINNTNKLCLTNKKCLTK